jgi:pyruvate formate-lyase/glycerol dehydratase family glycyl radical enzyme
MTDRVARLREASLVARPSISAERALLLTRFYRDNLGKHSTPVLRALAFKHLCQYKTIYIGDDELIVGERGPEPAATPTYPELTCHTGEDLRVLNDREKTSYAVAPEVVQIYIDDIIPFWKGRSLRDRLFWSLPPDWKAAYEAGVFTEFMEQRAPGHTVADGKIYEKGMLDLKAEIAAELARPTPGGRSTHRDEELRAMDIAADAMILFAERHAVLAGEMAETESDPTRKTELMRIRDVCSRVPARAPRDFHEALQMYWFCHLAVITELNGWDSFCPGHLDQHLRPFYQRGLADGTLTRESAKELLECFFVKFNNHPAPPKVGVTAAESGTYTDFANINLAGLTRDGEDGSNDLSFLLLEVIDEMHLLQPSQNVQVSERTPDAFLKEACRVIRKGYGYPSVFNADQVVAELLRQGKSIEDAREGGTSGCVEAGAFGKEAYILTGYFNLPKVLEITLHNGVDPRSGKQIGPTTGDPKEFAGFGELVAAFDSQLRHFLDIKLRGNDVIEATYAAEMPAPFLSLITDDCIKRGLDYNEGGARYNTSYIQGVGIGTITDSLAAIRKHVFEERSVSMERLLEGLAGDFAQDDDLRRLLLNRSPKWGNDDDKADELMRVVFDLFFDAVDGRPNLRSGTYHVLMLPTTCHIYFGSVTGATPDGRRARTPLSEGISPVQGADRKGPTAVFLSAAKMDHVRTGGTLLNMKFAPEALAEEDDLGNLAGLIRTYFKLGGHHVQFNVVSAKTLRDAQEHPEEHRDLIVRVAGYSDYFTDISRALQDEIISRTEQESTR